MIKSSVTMEIIRERGYLKSIQVTIDVPGIEPAEAAMMSVKLIANVTDGIIKSQIPTTRERTK